jgi:hypothetical protein
MSASLLTAGCGLAPRVNTPARRLVARRTPASVRAVTSEQVSALESTIVQLHTWQV